MRKRLFRKYIASVVAVLCIGLVACGGKESDGKTDGTTNTENDTKVETTVSAPSEEGTDTVDTNGTDADKHEEQNPGGDVVITAGEVTFGDPSNDSNDSSDVSQNDDKTDETKPVVTEESAQTNKTDVPDDKTEPGNKNDESVKVTTTTKPLIQVLPDGGLLLPDDIWE